VSAAADPSQAGAGGILQPGVPRPPAFPSTSRYADVPIAVLALPDGRAVAYLRRRFVPPPERFALLTEHVVGDGERLDTIAAQHLGDPEQFWRICDANNAIEPEELIRDVGRVLRITLPEGIPGPPRA
jgi:hypothetical protein